MTVLDTQGNRYIKDDLYRRAKAQAVLQGKSVGRFLEIAIERALVQDSNDSLTCAEWVATLPPLTKQATEDLEKMLAAPDFRTVDPEM